MEPDDIVEPNQDASRFTCEECGYEAKNALGLGAHRFHKHGVSGTAKEPKEPKKRAQPSTRAPSIKATIKTNVKMTYGLGATFIGQPFPNTAKMTLQNLDQIAEAWAAMSDEEWVRRLWGMAGDGAKWAGIVMVHLPILIGVRADIELRRLARLQAEEEAAGEAPLAEPSAA